jgi:hypothetical protein
MLYVDNTANYADVDIIEMMIVNAADIHCTACFLDESSFITIQTSIFIRVNLSKVKTKGCALGEDLKLKEMAHRFEALASSLCKSTGGTWPSEFN